MTLREIQNEVIRKYRVTINENSECWGRMHSHIKARTVCKWHPTSSLQSTFDLFHEIGHIETTKAGMRRCEEEFYATQWAIDRFKEYGLELPEKKVDSYQDYILRELGRGIRRHGNNLPSKGELTLRRNGSQECNACRERTSNLKRIRESKGMSQSQLAKASGVNVRMIQYYEQGAKDINKASVETVVKMADALGVDVKRIME